MPVNILKRGGKVKVYANPTEEYVEISVEDTGYGLSEEDVTYCR